MFNPTIWGRIVDERDQVFITVFCPERITASTFFISLALIAGPFLVDLDISSLYLPTSFYVLLSIYRKPLVYGFYNPELAYPRVF